jgi:hypothetical protein
VIRVYDVKGNVIETPDDHAETRYIIDDSCALYGTWRSVIECHAPMPEITYLKVECQPCKGHIEYPSEFGGQSIECPHCKQMTTLPPPPFSAPPPAVQQSVKASIRKASSFAGVGCLLQGIGVVCFILAIVTVKTPILPIILGILGLWLSFYGSRKASWYECSLCGGKLSHAHVSVCPHCNARFRD